MILLDESNAADYLRAAGHVPPHTSMIVQPLAGGVSNQVLAVRFPGGDRPDLVLKQARRQLRVADPWFSRLERVWREVEVLRICAAVLDVAQEPGSDSVRVPQVLFEDRPQYLFAMTAAPPGHTTWKQQLLAGQFEPRIARHCGELLGRLHAGTWHDAGVAARLQDRQVFDELRLDPYYRTIAAVHEDLRPQIERLIDSIGNHAHALTHADFSPKNLLVWEGGMMLVDFETGHYGDPAFDLGFFMSHLLLKSFQHAPRHEGCLALAGAFLCAHRRQLEPVISAADYEALLARGMQNLAGCLLARVDGKSKIDYLHEPPRRDEVRRLARHLLTACPRDWDAVQADVHRRLTERFSREAW